MIKFLIPTFNSFNITSYCVLPVFFICTELNSFLLLLILFLCVVFIPAGVWMLVVMVVLYVVDLCRSSIYI